MARFAITKKISGETYYLKRLERERVGLTESIAVYTKEPGAALIYKSARTANKMKQDTPVLRIAEVTQL